MFVHVHKPKSIEISETLLISMVLQGMTFSIFSLCTLRPQLSDLAERSPAIQISRKTRFDIGGPWAGLVVLCRCKNDALLFFPGNLATQAHNRFQID